MDRIIAYCGLVCSDCAAYVATQAGDQAALERVAAKWREEYNAPDITVESVICDGCLTGPRKCSHCAECDIRACGIGRVVVNCGHCADYVSCDKLERFFGFVPAARTVLEGIRQSL